MSKVKPYLALFGDENDNRTRLFIHMMWKCANNNAAAHSRLNYDDNDFVYTEIRDPATYNRLPVNNAQAMLFEDSVKDIGADSRQFSAAEWILYFYQAFTRIGNNAAGVANNRLVNATTQQRMFQVLNTLQNAEVDVSDNKYRQAAWRLFRKMVRSFHSDDNGTAPIANFQSTDIQRLKSIIFKSVEQIIADLRLDLLVYSYMNDWYLGGNLNVACQAANVANIPAATVAYNTPSHLIAKYLLVNNSANIIPQTDQMMNNALTPFANAGALTLQTGRDAFNIGIRNKVLRNKIGFTGTIDRGELDENRQDVATLLTVLSDLAANRYLTEVGVANNRVNVILDDLIPALPVNGLAANHKIVTLPNAQNQLNRAQYAVAQPEGAEAARAAGVIFGAGAGPAAAAAITAIGLGNTGGGTVVNIAAVAPLADVAYELLNAQSYNVFNDKLQNALVLVGLNAIPAAVAQDRAGGGAGVGHALVGVRAITPDQAKHHLWLVHVALQLVKHFKTYIPKDFGYDLIKFYQRLFSEDNTQRSAPSAMLRQPVFRKNSALAKPSNLNKYFRNANGKLAMMNGSQEVEVEVDSKYVLDKHRSDGMCKTFGTDDSNPAECSQYLRECLLGNKIDQCRNFFAKEGFFAKIDNEIENMLPTQAVQILSSFSVNMVLEKGLIVPESIESWKSNLTNKGLTPADANQINGNGKLLSYISSLCNKVRQSPGILNASYKGKPSTNGNNTGNFIPINPNSYAATLGYKFYGNPVSIIGGGITTINMSGGESVMDSINTVLETRKYSSDTYKKAIDDSLAKLRAKGKAITSEDEEDIKKMLYDLEQSEAKLERVHLILERYREVMDTINDNQTFLRVEKIQELLAIDNQRRKKIQRKTNRINDVLMSLNTTANALATYTSNLPAQPVQQVVQTAPAAGTVIAMPRS